MLVPHAPLQLMYVGAMFFFLAGLNRPSPFIPLLYYGMFTNIHVNVLVPSANVGYIHVPKMERRGVRRSPGRKVLDTFFG